MGQIFRKGITLEEVNSRGKNTMVEHLGIEFTEIGDDYLIAKMPVDHRTHQPIGLLHGGASMALIETVGSVAANFAVDLDKQYCVGLEINGNHVRGIREGWVFGKAIPLHLGKSTQVWAVNVVNEEDKLVCTGRITMAVLDRK